jgi:hypothetical protein
VYGYIGLFTSMRSITAPYVGLAEQEQDERTLSARDTTPMPRPHASISASKSTRESGKRESINEKDRVSAPSGCSSMAAILFVGERDPDPVRSDNWDERELKALETVADSLVGLFLRTLSLALGVSFS